MHLKGVFLDNTSADITHIEGLLFLLIEAFMNRAEVCVQTLVKICF